MRPAFIHRRKTQPQEFIMNVIDFRVRPPYKEFIDLDIMKRYQHISTDPMKWVPAIHGGRKQVPSIVQKDINLFIKEMDEAHVTLAGVMGRRTGDVWGDVSSDTIQNLIQEFPGRFFGFAGINPHEADAVEQIDKYVGQQGFKGISIDAGWCNPPLYVDDPKIFPIYEKCSEYKCICNLTMSNAVGPDLTYTDPVRLQHVATRYPNVTFCVAHACFPYFPEVMSVVMRTQNVYLIPDMYFYLPGMPGASDMAKAANSFLKYKLLFATSFPMMGFAQCVQMWAETGLTDEALELSLYNNAARLLES